jgi:hypothetical protein
MPALAQKTSRPPNSDCARWTSDCTKASDPASPVTATALPPASVIALAVSPTASALSAQTRLGAFAAKSWAAARPMPLARAGDDGRAAGEASHGWSLD